MTDLLHETKALLPEHEVTGYDDHIEVKFRIDIDGTSYNGQMDFFYADQPEDEKFTAVFIKNKVDNYLRVETALLRGELDAYL